MAKVKIILLRVFFFFPFLRTSYGLYDLTALLNVKVKIIIIILQLKWLWICVTVSCCAHTIKPSICTRTASHFVFYRLSWGICRTVIIKNTNCGRSPMETCLIICILTRNDLCGRTGSWRNTYPRPTKRDWYV